jgi:hypothetical protein
MRMDGQEMAREHLEAVLSARTYLVQEWLVPRQHDAAARFNPAVINSLRLISFDMPHGPRVVTAYFRSAVTSASVDNWHAGGVAVAVDLERGTLRGSGLRSQGDAHLAVHPVSGIAFDGQPVPHFRQAMVAAERLHAKLRARTLGWDIALLTDGPAVLECNYPGWSFMLPAIFYPGLTQLFLATHLPRPEESRRFTFIGSFPERERVWRFLCRALARAQVSGRLESLSAEEFAVTIAGSRAALNFFTQLLRSPNYRGEFRTARWVPSKARIRPGLDLSISLPVNGILRSRSSNEVSSAPDRRKAVRPAGAGA